jgi:hypothetical protein
MISMNSSWHVFFAALILMFCGGNLMWLQFYGVSGNVIQQSLVTGYFWLIVGVAVSLGIAPAINLMTDLIKALPPVSPTKGQ